MSRRDAIPDADYARFAELVWAAGWVLCVGAAFVGWAARRALR